MISYLKFHARIAKETEKIIEETRIRVKHATVTDILILTNALTAAVKKQEICDSCSGLGEIADDYVEDDDDEDDDEDEDFDEDDEDDEDD